MILQFENSQVNLGDYPPAPVTWLLLLVDTVCIPLQCSDWRQTLGIPAESWFYHTLPSVVENRPKLLGYSEFLAQQSGETNPWSPSTLYQYAFQTPSTALGDVLTPTAFGVVLVLLFLLRQFNAVFIPYVCSLGREVARRERGEEWVQTHAVHIQRFGETVYQLLCHGFLAIFGVYHFYSQEWWSRDGWRFTGTKSLFQGFPNQPIDPGMAWFYIFQAAYNLDAIISLVKLSFTLQLRWPVASSTKVKSQHGIPYVLYDWQSPIKISWSDEVRDDFREMAFHDVLTNSLCIGSSFCRMNRVGSMVHVVHDVSAVFVKISKISHFLNWATATLISFTAMLSVWFVTRLYILPFVILRGTIMYQHYILEHGLNPMFWICYRLPFDYGLAALCLLQLYWFTNYFRSYVKMVKKTWRKINDHLNGRPLQQRSKVHAA